jgi:hypothetical protein
MDELETEFLLLETSVNMSIEEPNNSENMDLETTLFFNLSSIRTSTITSKEFFDSRYSNIYYSKVF